MTLPFQLVNSVSVSAGDLWQLRVFFCSPRRSVTDRSRWAFEAAKPSTIAASSRACKLPDGIRWDWAICGALHDAAQVCCKRAFCRFPGVLSTSRRFRFWHRGHERGGKPL